MAAPSFSTMRKFFTKGEAQFPKRILHTKKFVKEEFESLVPEKLSFSWFGHSSVLLNIGDKIILIDPVFGKRASLFSLVGPKKFNYSNSYFIEQMPQIDAVLISHDHYDHLEYESILALKNKANKFYVALGVRGHLEKWGVAPEKIVELNHKIEGIQNHSLLVAPEKIVELNWWEEVAITHEIKLVFTPTCHFSGRGLLCRNQTLWGSWAIIGQKHKVFFSCDSGYFNVFKKVGENLGPFDLVFVENGQYNDDWASIHMNPEQSALAANELKAKAVVPIHWRKFSLSTHAWDEPVKRFLKASENYDYKVLTPMPGEIMIFPWTDTIEWWKF